MVDSRKLLSQIKNAGRTDFKVTIKKKQIDTFAVDDNFEMPEINVDDLIKSMNGNTARPEDITLREGNEEFLQFDEEMDITVSINV